MPQVFNHERLERGVDGLSLDGSRGGPRRNEDSDEVQKTYLYRFGSVAGLTYSPLIKRTSKLLSV